jgi:hypothetical protein
MPFGDPPQRKEGCVSRCFGQNVEQAFGIALDSARQAVPIAAIDGRGESFDLKIILDIDRRRVREVRGRPPLPACIGR